jgi:riboflavin synthase
VFTGLVQEVGRVTSMEAGDEGASLVVAAPRAAATVGIGGSVSIDGCCLTVESVDGDGLRFHAVPETLRRTTLGGLEPASEVNVEAALRAGEPLGGHIVQGHVDGVGRVRSVTPEGDGVRVVVEAGPSVLRYCVEKGSIAVDGVSLTVAALEEDAFVVALIPHTLEVTTLGALTEGAAVNLEVDVLAKYVERLLPPRP